MTANQLKYNLISGPVNVTGWDPRRCLGTWRVTPGSVNSLFGARVGEEVKLKWRFPGGEEHARTIKVTDKCVSITDIVSTG